MNLSQWVSAGGQTEYVNLSQVEAVKYTGAGPYTLQAVNGANTYALDGFSYATTAAALAGIASLVGVGAALYPGDPTVTIGNVHDV